MKKNKILAFVKSKSVSAFLETFFRDSGKYSPVFCSTITSVCDSLSKDGILAVVAEASLLPLISMEHDDVPVVALISDERKKGVAAAEANKTDGYITKPFLAADLTYALRSAIRHREAVAVLKQEIKDLRTINELTRLISSTLDTKELLYLIVKKIAEIMPVSRCSIIRTDGQRKYAYVVASFESPHIDAIRLDLKKYPEILEALVRKKPIVIKNIAADPIMLNVRSIISALDIRSILVMPILFEKKVIGTLFLRTTRKRHAFDLREIRLLQTIADASANTLYHAYLFAQIETEKTRLEKLSITDFLTGIYNVRYFQHRIVEEFSRAERYGMPISCLMIDIDFFKKINDSYGHKIGDTILKEFAQQLKRCTRKSDVLARYGGEEFIVMLPQTTAQGAIAEAERIRTGIKRFKFKGLHNQRGLTVSVGVSTFPNAKIKDHDELISSADSALYEAKSNGRDCVILFA
jgi:diguanylate cyclase (GGDEF)-like protein